ncbi:hypothetical protein MMC25_004587 [Agyrium rufum]|nr:hypothetical protein [Agyrium rufum]
MPALDSPQELVARFLRANNYQATLDTFIKEAGLSPGAGTLSKDSLTIEKILEEKKIFDISVRFEKLGSDDGIKGWTEPAPAVPTILSTLPSASNILHASVEGLVLENDVVQPVVLTTTADRRLSMLEAVDDYTLLRSDAQIHDSSILSCLVLRNGQQSITTSMSGQVVLYDHAQRIAIDERRDHKKYVVKAEMHQSEGGTWLATAAWDARVYLYYLHHSPSAGSPTTMGNPIGMVELSTNPETLLIVNAPEHDSPLLIVTRRDSTHLYFYALPPIPDPSSSTSDHQPSTPPSRLHLLGTQNLAPHANAWISFSPSSIALSPLDPTILAVATSSLPHMKLLIVRLLFPSSSTSTSAPAIPEATQASQARTQLALQDREAAAILVHSNTLAPQTQYSTPQVVWRPDGSGVWVNGDDGIVRGVEARSGKVLKTLKEGHEAGVKIRSLWAGMVRVGNGGDEEEEWLVSGGFDKRLIVWRVGGGDGSADE